MERKVTITDRIIDTVYKIANDRGVDVKEIQFRFKEIYDNNPEIAKESVRARLYESLGVLFKRIGRDLYALIVGDTECVVVEGDGTEVDFIPDGFAQLVINDKIMIENKKLSGLDGNCEGIESSGYTLEDFREKYRILEQGGFLVEFVPEEDHTNFEWLYSMKKTALAAGFEYYTKVTWLLKNWNEEDDTNEEIEEIVTDSEYKIKNGGDVIIFTKGKARSLREDAKKTKATGEIHYMSGASSMIPAEFSYPDIPLEDRICPSEKPLELIKKIIELFTKPGECVVDQNAGAGTTGEACISLEKPRKCILIEKAKEYVENIIERLGCVTLTKGPKYAY